MGPPMCDLICHVSEEEEERVGPRDALGLTLLVLQFAIKALLTRKIIRACLRSRGFYVVNPLPISFGVPWRVRGLVNSGMISTTMEDCGNVAAPWVTFESKKKKEKKKVFFSHVVQGCAKEDAS